MFPAEKSFLGIALSFDCKYNAWQMPGKMKSQRNFILPGLGARARRVVDSMRRLSSFARRVVLDVVVSVLVDANPRSVGVVGADAVRVSDICQTGIDSAVARHLVAFRLAVHKFLMPIGRTLTIASNAKATATTGRTQRGGICV